MAEIRRYNLWDTVPLDYELTRFVDAPETGRWVKYEDLAALTKQAYEEGQTVGYLAGVEAGMRSMVGPPIVLESLSRN